MGSQTLPQARGAASAQGQRPPSSPCTWTGAPVHVPTAGVAGHSFGISPTLTGQTWQGLSSTPDVLPQPTALRWGPESGPCVPRLLEDTATPMPVQKMSADLSPEVRRRLSESCRQPVTSPTGVPKPCFRCRVPAVTSCPTPPGPCPPPTKWPSWRSGQTRAHTQGNRRQSPRSPRGRREDNGTRRALWHWRRGC